MLNYLKIQNFKALRDVELELTPFHVVIGPNDAGKSSILQAIVALGLSTRRPLTEAFAGRWQGQELVSRGASEEVVRFAARFDQPANEYMLAVTFESLGHQVRLFEEMIRDLDQPEGLQLANKANDGYSRVFRITAGEQGVPPQLKELAQSVSDSLIVRMHRWDPYDLALPVALDSKKRFLMEPSGFGLARCLDDILSFDRELFTALETRFRHVFPEFRSVKLVQQPAFRSERDNQDDVPILQRAEGKGLAFELNSRVLIPASQVSDGVLLVLAYITVLHLPEPPRILLVEEPENGIHPKRLREVIHILQELLGANPRTQVVVTTHSPYVVDLFKPDQVTLCQKAANGLVVARRLSESEKVKEQIDVFTLGEIWTAEGDERIGEPSRLSAKDE